MPASKIQDEQEVLRWMQEGKTYREMCDIYRTKYNLTVVPSLFGNFRRRRGLARRITLDSDLIPWQVKPVHRGAYPLAMLRREARLRDGREISEDDHVRLSAWKRMLDDGDFVVEYLPDTPDGFFYVTRQPGETLIRVPAQSTRVHVAVD